MYQALYRANRPEIFSELLGQEHIVKILKHQIETGTVSHAYLFCGTRGTGKTTTARILAKAVNCTSDGEKPCGVCPSCQAIKDGNFMDVIEIDAASNNGVDNIRELRESVKYPPQAGKKKVYIIDEVHMLSPGAFNALLKTLEEPPENVIFILATTEPQKLPQTILSRCMKLDFKRVPLATIASGMKKICDEKGVEVTESALKLLSNAADGSVRDGLSILDQVLASGEKKIDREDVLEYIGAVGDEFFIELTDYVSTHQISEALVLLDKALSEGKDVKQLMKDWTSHYRNLLITKFIKNPEDMLNMSTENIEKIKEQTEHISMDEINDAIVRLSKTINDARWSTQPRILLELAIVEISQGGFQVPAKVTGTVQTVQTSQAAPAQIRQAAAREAAPVTASDPETAPQPKPLRKAEMSADNEQIWRQMMEKGEATNGSFNLVRSWASLVEIGVSGFTVSVMTEFAKKHIEELRPVMEQIASDVIGRPVKMNIKLQGAKPKDDPGEEYNKIAKDASEMLGIDIVVE